MKIKLSKNWKHEFLAQMDFVHLITPVNQLMRIMPKENERTEDEKSLFAALKTIDDFINKYNEEEDPIWKK